jgi:hypothetical protein
MFLRQITDSSLAQNAYLIGCQRTGEAVIVNPERAFSSQTRLGFDLPFSNISDFTPKILKPSALAAIA